MNVIKIFVYKAEMIFMLLDVQVNIVIYPGTQVTGLIKITARQDVLKPGTR